MTRERLIPGPDHPIEVAADPAHVVVRVGDTVVADTRGALALREAGYPPVHYVPLADVDRAVLRPSDTRTYCPYKGEASYYDVVTSTGEVGDAVWFYPEPYDAVAEIAGHVAFYSERTDVQVGA